MTTFGAALEFSHEHEYCGELDTGLEDDRVWMMCRCGARIVWIADTRLFSCPPNWWTSKLLNLLDDLWTSYLREPGAVSATSPNLPARL